MNTVFVLTHEYPRVDCDESKLVGIYSSLDSAQSAIARSRTQPGFVDWPDGFVVDEREIDKDSWTKGFSIVTHIFVPLWGTEPQTLSCVGAERRTGDIYRIFHSDGDTDVDRWEFPPGSLVRCEKREVNGTPGCLVAVAIAQ